MSRIRLAAAVPCRRKPTWVASSAMPKGWTAHKVRARSEKFFDHFSQAALFWNSQSEPEKAHIVQALRFEFGKVEVACHPGADGWNAGARRPNSGRAASRKAWAWPCPTRLPAPLNMSIPADGNAKQFQPKPIKKPVGTIARSQHGEYSQGRDQNTQGRDPRGRRIRCRRAFRHEEGFDRGRRSSEGRGAATRAT